MPKQVSLGGQKRKYECSCGYRAEGDVRSANFKIKLHNKVCEHKEMHKNFKPPVYNKAMANNNGRDGFRGSEVTTSQMATVIADGKEIGYEVKNKITKEVIYIDKI